jgi:hypothetical protein
VNYLQLPSEVMVHLSRLSAVQLAIWADAWTWAQNGKPAYRTNEQLAEIFGITPKSVSRAIAALKSYGMMDAQTANGRQRILIARIPSNVHPRQRTSPQTSIPSNVHPASPPTSTLHPLERTQGIPSNVHQEDNREENRIEKRIEKGPPPKREQVDMPWPSDEFAKAWQDWKDYKRAEKDFKYKSPKSEQIALHKLYNDAGEDQYLAIYAIGTSIANGWAGLFINPQLKREFSGVQKRAGIDTFADELEEYLRNGGLRGNR